MDWGNGNAKKAATMLQWQGNHLPSPFTRAFDAILDTTAKKEMKKLVLHCYSTVQKAMGDRNTSRATQRLQEIGLDAVMHPKVLPDEIYLSIIKQCTGKKQSYKSQHIRPYWKTCTHYW